MRPSVTNGARSAPQPAALPSPPPRRLPIAGPGLLRPNRAASRHRSAAHLKLGCHTQPLFQPFSYHYLIQLSNNQYVMFKSPFGGKVDTSCSVLNRKMHSRRRSAEFVYRNLVRMVERVIREHRCRNYMTALPLFLLL